MKLSIPIGYMQTEEQSFYSMKAVQYEISAGSEKLYVAFYREQRVAVVVHRMEKREVPREFHLDSYVETKFGKMEEERELQLFLPVWQNNISFKGKGSSPNPFSYRQ